METINIDILPGDVTPVCHASQYDVGRTIQINLMQDSKPYEVEFGQRLVLEMKKPDTNVVSAPINYNVGNSTIYFTTTEQMCACPGSNKCEIRITKGNISIGTLNFILEVERDPKIEIESTSEIYDLAQRIIDIVRRW